MCQKKNNVCQKKNKIFYGKYHKKSKNFYFKPNYYITNVFY